MRIFENIHIDWMGKRKVFYIVSAVLFFLGLINILIRGLEFGIDFKGGSEIVLQFDKPIDIAKIRTEVDKLGLGTVELKTFGGDNTVLIRTEMQSIPNELYPKVIKSIQDEIDKAIPGVVRSITDSAQNSITFTLPNPDTTNILVEKLSEAGFQTGKISEEPTNTQILVSVGISDWIKENLKAKFQDNPFKVLKEDQVGPKVGSELKRDAVLAVLLSLVAILIYLAFRFKFIFATGAVLALFHDVLITLGLYALLYGVIPGLNLEIDLSIVAAFLTLVGYSINDTVIVFDRVRENLKIHKTKPLFDVMNMSINRTMSRTIITSGTTLLAVIVILLFGGEVLRPFAFTLAFGIIIGTYSSIFVASALVLEYVNKTKKKVEF